MIDFQHFETRAILSEHWVNWDLWGELGQRARAGRDTDILSLPALATVLWIMRCVLINLSCYLPTFCSITSGPKCQSSNQNGQIISYPCKDFQMYFYFSLFVKLQRNVTGKLPLFSVIWRFLRLAPLAGAKNFFYIVSYIFGKPIQFPCSGDM